MTRSHKGPLLVAWVNWGKSQQMRPWQTQVCFFFGVVLSKADIGLHRKAARTWGVSNLVCEASFHTLARQSDVKEQQANSKEHTAVNGSVKQICFCICVSWALPLCSTASRKARARLDGMAKETPSVSIIELIPITSPSCRKGNAWKTWIAGPCAFTVSNAFAFVWETTSAGGNFSLEQGLAMGMQTHSIWESLICQHQGQNIGNSLLRLNYILDGTHSYASNWSTDKEILPSSPMVHRSFLAEEQKDDAFEIYLTLIYDGDISVFFLLVWMLQLTNVFDVVHLSFSVPKTRAIIRVQATLPFTFGICFERPKFVVCNGLFVRIFALNCRRRLTCPGVRGSSAVQDNDDKQTHGDPDRPLHSL